MTANDSQSYLNYLDKLVGQCSKTYHWLQQHLSETELSYKAPSFKVGDKVRITKYKNIFCKCYTENWSREISVIDFEN